MSIDDLHERLEAAFEAVSPHPAPLEETVRRGRTIKRRRAALAVGVAAVAAAAGFGVPTVVHRVAGPAPASPSGRVTVTVQPPGPGAQPGEIATGTINGKRWWIVADRPGTDGAGAGQQDIVIAGPGVEADGGHVPLVQALSTAHSLGPVAFTAIISGSAGQALVGAVRADVSYVTVRLGDGSVLTLHPVTVWGTRAVALALPAGTQIADAVAYSAHGEIGYAVPFNQFAGVAWFVAWLTPGQHQAPRVSGRIASGTASGAASATASGAAGGQAWSAIAYQGPWGICIAVAGLQSPQLDCVPAVPGPVMVLDLGQGGTPEIEGGIASASVTRVVVTQPDGSTLQARLVAVGGRKFFAFAVRAGAKPLRWVAYDQSGQVVASS